VKKMGSSEWAAKWVWVGMWLYSAMLIRELFWPVHWQLYLWLIPFIIQVILMINENIELKRMILPTFGIVVATLGQMADLNVARQLGFGLVCFAPFRATPFFLLWALGLFCWMPALYPLWSKGAGFFEVIRVGGLALSVASGIFAVRK
jgi:hypothetical protein